MIVPPPLEITASLLAGYRFTDGSLIEVDNTGDFIITSKDGTILVDTVQHGGGMRSGAGGWQDYGKIIDDLAAFLKHDAEIWEFSPEGSWGKRHPESAIDIDDQELIFNREVAQWADEHDYELCELNAQLEGN